MANGIAVGFWMAVIGPGIVNEWERDGYSFVSEIPKVIEPDWKIDGHEVTFKHLPLTGANEFKARIEVPRYLKAGRP